MPMDRNFTQQFVSFHDIDVHDIDLYEDAFGLYFEYHGMMELLRKEIIEPDKKITRHLIDKIRKRD